MLWEKSWENNSIQERRMPQNIQHEFRVSQRKDKEATRRKPK